MPLPCFDELFASADATTPSVTVVAAGGADFTVLKALVEARRRGWVRPIVTGRRDEIESVAGEHGVWLDGVKIVESDDPARAAVDLARQCKARLLMKGQIATPDLMRAVL